MHNILSINTVQNLFPIFHLFPINIMFLHNSVKNLLSSQQYNYNIKPHHSPPHTIKTTHTFLNQYTAYSEITQLASFYSRAEQSSY